jgi:hypothetical protein
VKMRGGRCPLAWPFGRSPITCKSQRARPQLFKPWSLLVAQRLFAESEEALIE